MPKMETKKQKRLKRNLAQFSSELDADNNAIETPIVTHDDDILAIRDHEHELQLQPPEEQVRDHEFLQMLDGDLEYAQNGIDSDLEYLQMLNDEDERLWCEQAFEIEDKHPSNVQGDKYDTIAEEFEALAARRKDKRAYDKLTCTLFGSSAKKQARTTHQATDHHPVMKLSH